MMGRGLNLSPIVVILCLIFWGWVWGIVGMFLAVPLTSSFVLIFENIEPLRPIAVMLSGKEEPRKSKS
jgi:predicted PurR-regulated permease PerM